MPAQAAIVKCVFEETRKGVSQWALARRFNAEGPRPAQAHAWGHETVGRILSNPIYRGAIRHSGEEHPGGDEAISSVELWEGAAAIRSNTARRAKVRWPKGLHLLTKGLLRGHCGYAMTPRTDPGRANYEVCECAGRKARGVEFWRQASLHRRLIDEGLLADLLDHYVDLDATRRRLQQRRAPTLPSPAKQWSKPSERRRKPQMRLPG